MTYLNDAIIEGNLEKVRNLIEQKGYSVNYTGLTGLNDTPLLVAAKHFQRDIMEYLIQQGADVNAKGYWGFGSTPLETVVSGWWNYYDSKPVPVVALLLANHATGSTDEMVRKCFMRAIKSNDTWSMNQLLTHTEIDANTVFVSDHWLYGAENETALQMAVKAGGLDAVNLLIERGADINAVSVTAIPNGAPKTALNLSLSGCPCITKVLIEHGADINLPISKKNDVILFKAVMFESEEFADLLLEKGANINHKNDEGYGVLNIAAGFDSPKMIKYLVAHGADISEQANQVAPLETAAKYGNLQALSTLIELGADINHKNAEGKTALEVAFKGEQMGAVNMLLVYGAEIPSVFQAQLDNLKLLDAAQILPEVTSLSAEIVDNSSHAHELNLTNSTSSYVNHTLPIGAVLNVLEQNPIVLMD